ncbi:MAG: dTDP-glucose 4,6-dehydratase [ANME-2 cluster archaeon]|jgi:dTDP-glucose 4,6-dehydratase|nr:dTDP-glucose 4,6-dehydratase [ANME-2 cluster archaeon]
MKILVTGGAGFIGSNYIRMMFNRYPDMEITNLDKLTYAGNPENLRGISNPGYTFIKGDICDPDTVKRAMEGADAVVHFAAESHVDRSIEDSSVFVTTNLVGTNTLLNCALGSDISRFIHISTDEVYGSIDVGSFTEEDPLEPSSPYSSSKAGSDLLALSYKTTYGLPVVVTRCTNNFGPYQYPEKLISLFITNLIEGKQVPVYGTGLNVRDWIYVEDHCSGIDFVFNHGQNGEIYNIGGGNELTNMDITHRILEMMGRDESMIRYVEDRKGHDMRYSLDYGKLKRMGWKPEYDFDDALRNTVSWYMENKRWWKPLK